MDLKTAERLAKLRKERGLSQEELAERLGVSRQAVSKWERGESSPDTDNLIALAALYGVSLDELLSYRGAEKTGSDARDRGDRSAGGERDAYRTENGSCAGDENRGEDADRAGRGEETAEAGRDRGTGHGEEGTGRGDGDRGRRDYFTIRSETGEEVRFGSDGLRVDDGKGTRVSLAPFRIDVRTGEGRADSKSAGKDGGQRWQSADGEAGFDAKENVAEGDFDEAKRRAGIEIDGVPVFTCGKDDRLSPRTRKIVSEINGAIFFATLTAFLLWGFLGGETRYAGDWGRAWLALFALPTLASLVEAIAHRDPVRFAFPVPVVAAYLALGLYAELWHPGWVVFFSIPIYYMIAEPIRRALKR